MPDATRPSRARTPKPGGTAALAALLGAQWAILPDRLEAMAHVAARTKFTPKALDAVRGTWKEDTYDVETRDGIATLRVRGPLFRYANLMTAYCGATAYATVATDLRAALDDPGIRAIILDLDSPGGEVNGCAELAQMVYAARGVKPIVAYVGGLACSAGYWIAAAADRVVAANTALLGSIGVLATFLDTSEADRKLGLREFTIVSTQSPRKDIDPSTKDGRAQIQQTLDALASVFISAVADYRGVSVNAVLADYGQGGVFVGEAAVQAGLADAIGTYEELLAELRDGAGAGSTAPAVLGARRTTAGRTASTPATTALTSATSEDAMKTTPGAQGAAPTTGTPATPAATTPAAAAPPEDPEDQQDGGADEDEENEDGTKKKQDGAEEDGEPAAIRKAAAAAERARIAAIHALGKPGEEATIQACIDDPDCSPAEAALRLRQAEPKATNSRLAALAADDAGAHASAAPRTTETTPREAARAAVARFRELTTPKPRSRA